MIKKQYHIASATILMTALISGCTVGEPPQATNSPSAVPSPQQTVASGTTGQKPITTPGTKSQPFNTPFIEGSSKAMVGGLKLPTNKEERLNIIPKGGRTDPFAQIVDPFIPPSTGNMKDSEKVPILPDLPLSKKPVVTPLNTGTQKPSTLETKKPPTKPSTLQTKKPPAKPSTLETKKPPAKPVLPKLVSPVVSPVVIKPELPPAPQPDAAKAVRVSGVILIGKIPQAIIKVPDETTSRYVQPGQRLVNGVLVKRIEMNNGANPVVILEQYGIEVAKQIESEAPANKDQETKPSTTASRGNSSVLGVLW
jgi:hypothetical protein